MNLDSTSFIGAAGVILWFVYRTWRYSRQQARLSTLQGRSSPPVLLDATPDAPVQFGYQNSWLAVRAQSVEAVTEALGMNDLEPANWCTGIAAAYADAVFISPPVAGWVLLVSRRLPELDPRRRKAWDDILDPLAARFPQVCYFGTHRIVGYSAWARFADGRLRRAFSYLGERGEVLVNEGSPSPEEVDLGHRFSQLPVGPLTSGEDDDSPPTPDEEDVLDVAAAWSVSTRELPTLAAGRSAGFISRAWSVAEERSSRPLESRGRG